MLAITQRGKREAMQRYHKRMAFLNGVVRLFKTSIDKLFIVCVMVRTRYTKG